MTGLATRRPRGIIPAGAGRSLPLLRDRAGHGDHPRGCGEKGHRELCGLLGLGSSPRVRGEAKQTLAAGLTPGIIPAGAGRRRRKGFLHRHTQDHPRGCGEKLDNDVNDQWGEGSSPRVRGEVCPPYAGSGKGGIIPAGAGRSDNARGLVRAVRDHPRGCGEKSFVEHGWIIGLGSSPRVRGEDSGVERRPIRPGIIPAGAGRRFYERMARGGSRDHPRGCGEKLA